MTDQPSDGRYLAVLLSQGYTYEEIAEETGLPFEFVEEIAEHPLMEWAVKELEESGEWGVDIYLAVSYKLGEIIG